MSFEQQEFNYQQAADMASVQCKKKKNFHRLQWQLRLKKKTIIDHDTKQCGFSGKQLPAEQANQFRLIPA